MKALALGAGGLLLALGVLLLGERPADPPAAAPALAAAAAEAQRPAPRAAPAPSAPPAAGSAPAPRAASLRGTDWDGDWALDARSRLPRPSLQLRQRFDHLLTQLGEVPLPAIREQLRARLQADGLPEAARAALLERFDAYLALNQYPYRVRADAREPSTWAAALAERQQVRRQLLGADWAEAFYGDEERALQATLAALRGEAAAQAAAPEPPRHPQAAEREAAAEAAWAAWEQRLAEARAHWTRLRADASLSAPQRDGAWAAYLRERFDASETLRVRALVEREG